MERGSVGSRFFNFCGMNFFKKMSSYVPVVLWAALCAVACGDSGDSGTSVASAAFRYGVVDCETTRNQLLLTGEGLTFAATVTEGAEWLSFEQDSRVTEREGDVVPVVFVYLQRNTTSEDRTALVSVRFSNGEIFEVALTQRKYTPSAGYDKAWAEQPVFRSEADWTYKTYYTTLANGDYVRNYSICYDRNRRVAHWVAYPLHTVYTTPSVGRTTAWSYDPNVQPPAIPESAQQYVEQGYGTGLARGHQCPSADRYSTVPTNEQTFYATNMMPQNGDFNSGIWGTLENKVRENMVRDTLYVVTGTFFGDGRTTTDRRGNRIGLPSNCWKVLLRTRRGNTGKPVAECSADELIGIGFWFANDRSNPSSLRQCARSIAQIEELTGFTFFRNLAPEAAEAVKAQNDPADWKIN